MLDLSTGDRYYSSKRGAVVTYWEMLADSYGLPVELVMMLYEDWNPNEYKNFGDYVKARELEAVTSS